MYSGKGQKHSGKPSPSAKCTRGRASGNASHGKEVFPECQNSHTRGRLLGVPKLAHSGKASPSAVLALGEDFTPSMLSAFF
jgi:hypothetical protein